VLLYQTYACLLAYHGIQCIHYLSIYLHNTMAHNDPLDNQNILYIHLHNSYPPR
jgi:hypothetical protein